MLLKISRLSLFSPPPPPPPRPSFAFAASPPSVHMEHRRALGPIRHGSATPTDDQIVRVMRFCGGQTPANRDRAIGIRARLIGEEPSAGATLRYLPPRPAGVVLRLREVMPPPVMARRPHVCCHGGTILRTLFGWSAGMTLCSRQFTLQSTSRAAQHSLKCSTG
ncbi:hypothetical protein ACP4OV_012540 [Aristida adscensionis]